MFGTKQATELTITKTVLKIKGAEMRITDHIIKLYEMACEVLTPKSYQWKIVAQRMYEIAKEAKKE